MATTQKQVEAGKKSREDGEKYEQSCVNTIQGEFGKSAAIMAAKDVVSGKNLKYKGKAGQLTTKPDALFFFNTTSVLEPAKEFRRIYKIEAEYGLKDRLFSKSSALLEFLNNGQSWAGVSMKNSDKSTQIQITSEENLSWSLSHRTDPADVDYSTFADARTALKLFLGVGKDNEKRLLTEDHRTMVDSAGVSYDTLSSFEKSKGRLFYQNIPRQYRLALERFFDSESVKRALTDIVFSEGTAKPEDLKNHPELRADYVLWGYQEDPNSDLPPGDVNVFSVSSISHAVQNSPLRVNLYKSDSYDGHNMVLSSGERACTTLNIGPIQFQKKGSGKGSSYSNIQFNTSLNDLLEYVEPIYTGAIEGAYLKIKEHAQGFGRWDELSRKIRLKTKGKTIQEQYKDLLVRA